MARKHFEALKALSKEIHIYNSVLTLLHWDQETYMPPGGIGARSLSIAQMSKLIHTLKTSKTYKNHLSKLVHLSTGRPKAKGWSKPELVCLTEWHKEFLRDDKLPSSFVEEFSQLTSEASQVWSFAKQTNQFKLFAPFLEKIIAMNRKKGELLGFEEHPYDPLLAAYEPCMTSAKLDKLFGSLKPKILSLIAQINKKKPPNDRFLYRKVSQAKQIEVGKELLESLPMDLKESRLDLSSHPFSMALHPQDSRITTRILPNHLMSNLFSILHETGHSLYEMGLPAETWGTPLSESVSLSIHESQSRWWETLIGRSLPFWKKRYPLLQAKVPHLFKGVSLSQFYRAIHAVRPSFIRVESDEVHYSLHIILRFEIEKELLTEKLAVRELPDAWRAKAKELFGIQPPTDREGCLQDIHWSLGDFGYFPTYALGNLFAAQFFHAFAKEHPDWEEKVEQGELSFIKDWLQENIHRWGKTYNAERLVQKVTGHSLSANFYANYLKKKYLKS